MSAANAIMVARAAGIKLRVEGDDLLMEAIAPPSPAVLDLLVRHKAVILTLLRPGADGWSGEDWQAFPGERAAIADKGLTVATLSGWQRNFTRLDPCQPHEGFTMRRWQQLYDDSLWMLETHGVYAAKCGWTAADLFGLWPDKPHWGGIADRLRGARSLVMDADRASWRSWGQVERFNRSSYPHLRPFWEVKQ